VRIETVLKRGSTDFIISGIFLFVDCRLLSPSRIVSRRIPRACSRQRMAKRLLDDSQV